MLSIVTLESDSEFALISSIDLSMTNGSAYRPEERTILLPRLAFAIAFRKANGPLLGWTTIRGIDGEIGLFATDRTGTALFLGWGLTRGGAGVELFFLPLMLWMVP